MDAHQHIIAIGGGGFSDGSDPGLDRYVLAQARSEEPRVGFIGSASGDSERYLQRFYGHFDTQPCRTSHLPLFGRVPDVRAWALAQDVIFVGGGNTKSLLALWHAWGVPAALREALAQGVVLSGISAGAICWFEQGVTDSAAGALAAVDCLGLVPGSCCPHYSGEPERKPAYERMVGDGTIAAGFGIEDGAALHLRDGEPHRAVIGRAGAEVYAVGRRAAGGVEARPVSIPHEEFS